jgi:hypothetical protein
MDKILIEGNFGIYKGITYRTVLYWNDVELFSIEDNDHLYVISRVLKDEIEDLYTLFTYCRFNGIEYIVRKIENEIVTYERSVCDKVLFKKPLREFDVVFSSKKHHNQYTERKVLYINNKMDEIMLNYYFVPEEMHNGHIMLSYLDSVMNVSDTIKTLTDLYGDRIVLQGAALEMLIMDYYIERFTIDDAEFCIDSDYGIVTISPDNDNGDMYIWELTDYFNKKISK